jgi:uncharacterized membrane protein YfcA
MLGAVGGMMLNESARLLLAEREGASPPARRRAGHAWIHGLPFKLRFRQSRLYISAIPPLALGFIVGILSALMGVGGGFIIVPAMIYVLRMPTNVVMGTSLVPIVVVTAATTILQSVQNYTVDIMLALVLIAGGTVGAQLGVRIGSRLKAEQLRLLLAILVLVVAARLFYGLVATPDELYSVGVGSS